MSSFFYQNRLPYVSSPGAHSSAVDRLSIKSCSCSLDVICQLKWSLIIKSINQLSFNDSRPSLLEPVRNAICIWGCMSFGQLVLLRLGAINLEGSYMRHTMSDLHGI